MSAVLSDPAVQSAYGEYQRFSGDPRMREKVRARERFLEEQNIIFHATRAEGKAEGLAEGKAEIAWSMKAEGYESAVIAKLTGLSAAEIERL